MTITELVSDTYLRATGETTVLTTGTKYNRIITLADFYQRRWAREPGVDWASLYDPEFSLGNVTATDAYDIDSSTVRKLSNRQGDVVRIAWDDGNGYTDYDLVPHDKLKDFYTGVDKESYSGFFAAEIGKQLIFNHTFTTTDNEYGGEIFVPAYLYPDEITANNPNSDEVQVDDPDWLVVKCAAEYVRNDITRRSRYPELIIEANEIMTRMMEDNEAQINAIDKPWSPFSGINQTDAWS